MDDLILHKTISATRTTRAIVRTKKSAFVIWRNENPDQEP